MKYTITAIILLGSGLVLGQFPNLWLIVVSAMFVVLTFSMAQLFKKDLSLDRFVEKAHWLKLLLVLTPGLAFCFYLTGLMVWGLHLHMTEANFFGTTYIEKTLPGKGLPTGTYSNAVLTLGFMCILAFFANITFALLRGVFLGLRYRLGYAMRPEPEAAPAHAPLIPPAVRPQRKSKKRKH